MAPKPQDLPNMTGPGVELPKDKVLDKLGDEFKELLEQRATLSTKITKVEGKILERMTEKGLKKYRYADQEMSVKESKLHVKVKSVEANGTDAEDLENEND